MIVLATHALVYHQNLVQREKLRSPEETDVNEVSVQSSSNPMPINLVHFIDDNNIMCTCTDFNKILNLDKACSIMPQKCRIKLQLVVGFTLL